MVLLTEPITFSGFRPELLDFFDRLAVHNERAWFQAQRAAYEAYFLEPARQLVLALGQLLPRLGRLQDPPRPVVLAR